MKRLGILVLALAGLAALFGSCGGGGEEEKATLAVAFRLEEGSPVMVAYIGDPAEDPFQLPPGSYYIEALDQDDVVISLGAVDIEDGDVVEFPPSFGEAGGVADAERAEPLKTVANFLIDFELSEYVFLEAVTAGFTEFPFDPAVEPDAASVQELLGLYAEMAAQEEALEAALSQIDDRAEVSAGVLYVRSPWAPAPDLTDVVKKKLDDWKKSTFSFFHNATVVRQRKRILEIAEQIPEQNREAVFRQLTSDKKGGAASFDDWLNKVRTDDDFVRTEGSGIYYEMDGLDHEAVVDSGNSAINVLAEEGPKAAKYATEKVVEAYRHVPGMKRVFELGDKAKEWAEYAEKLAKDLGGTLEESARGRVQKALEDKVKSNLKERFPKLSGKAIDDLAQYFAKKAVAAVPKLAGTPTVAAPTATQAVPTPKVTPKVTPQVTPSASPAAPSPTAEVTPDTGWIEGYVGGIADQWLAKEIYGGIDVAVATDDLRRCLTASVLAGASQNEAIGECPAWLFEPSLTPEPTETPQPAETPQPPQPTQPVETPSPEARDVTAVGQYLRAATPGNVVLKNTMTLTFNTAGGPVEGDGEKDTQTAADGFGSCGTGMIYATFDYKGTYDAETNAFNGTFTVAGEGYSMLEFCESVGGELVCVCESVPWGDSFSGDWQATLEDGVVKGSQTVEVDTFELTVQG